MNLRVLAFAAIALGLGCLRAEDALDPATSAPANGAFPTQTSEDGRIKVTLLYVGPIDDPQIHQPFVVTYMIEDCRTDEELKRHPWKTTAGIISDYYIAPSMPQLRDVHNKTVAIDANERARNYKAADTPFFKSSYPKMVLPPTDHPDTTGIYEYFLRSVPEGPLDVTLRDSIPAYRANTFRFREVQFSPPPR